MKIIGVIMEINPFHNGHKYFLDQIPKKDGDILVAVISTSIVQRGEISVIDKKTKAKLLLDNRVDIVVELPSTQANQGGAYFAKNSINILNKFKITDLYFGSESNDLNYLYTKSLLTYNNDFKNGIHKTNLEHLNSNDILGISYLKAINNTNIKPHLIKRINNNYNDNNINTSSIQSATAIRKAHHINKDVSNFLPKLALDNIKIGDDQEFYKLFKLNLSSAIDNNINIMLSENSQILYKLDKIIRYNNFSKICELVEFAKDKNNSKYKLQRVIINTIFMIVDNCEINTIDYLHILGLSPTGSAYLRTIKNPLFVTSLKNQNSYNAKCELRISKFLESFCNFPKQIDYQPPVIK